MSWFDQAGQGGDVVIGTELTLTRNIEGFPFALGDPEKMTPEARAFLKSLSDTLSGGSLTAYEPGSIDPAALSVLVRKRFADPDECIGATLLLDEEHGVSVTLGGSDHVRIRVLLPGDALEEALEEAFRIESKLDSAFRIAFSEKFGYLTSSPAFLGSAAEFSLILHLPASGEVDPGGFVRLERLRGGLCVLSSEPFPGITEEEQIERLRLAEERLANIERSARAALRSDATRLCDRVMRAWGLLSNACLIGEDELYRLWSDLRLGAVIGLPGLPSPEELGSILMAALLCPPEKGDPEAARAMLLKRRLSSCRNACRV